MRSLVRSAVPPVGRLRATVRGAHAASPWPQGAGAQRRRHAALAAVAVLHALLVWALLHALDERPGTPRAGAPAPEVAWLWWRHAAGDAPPPAAVPPRPVPAPARQRPDDAARQRRPAADSGVAAGPAPSTVPSTAPVEPIDIGAARLPAEAGPAASAAQPPPLRLDRTAHGPASPPSPAALATQDPRVATPADGGQRFAGTLGTDQTLRADTLNGGTRYRRGTDCVVVRPARDGQLDPFNRSTRPLPSGVGRC